LLQAGLARELVHRIQTMRKDAGFEVEDRIVTRFDANGELAAVFERFGDYIRQETLSVSLESGGNGEGYNWSGQIEGEPVTIGVALAGGAAHS
jgi:isoleucyl-tRNA synthetase